MANILLATGCVFVVYAAISFLFGGVAGSIVALLAGAVLVWDVLLYKTGRFKLLFKFSVCATILMYAFLAGMIIFISCAARNTAEYDEDAAVILGAGIRGDAVSPMLAARLDAAADYLKKNPKAVAVVSGGRGSWESISEALSMQRYLTDKGIPQDRILLEDKSANTYQNLKYSKKILDAYFDRPYTVVCITSRSHLYRARRIGRKLDMPMRGLPAKIPFYLWPSVYFRETLALPNSVLRF